MTGVRFRTTDGVTLEGELREADGPPRGTAVLCHAHPQHGGSKDHPVLWAIRNDLAARRGLTVLGFNFRGVMGSAGEHGGGREELKDVASAVDRVRQEADGPTVMVGWSFGASMALRHSLSDERVAALVLLGIPLGESSGRSPAIPGPGGLESYRRPVLLVAGDDDEICPVDSLGDVASRLPRAWTLVVPGGGHYFSRREREVAERIGQWVDRTLGDQP
jgi:alpha/beta superfamily hydrolase